MVAKAASLQGEQWTQDEEDEGDADGRQERKERLGKKARMRLGWVQEGHRSGTPTGLPRDVSGQGAAMRDSQLQPFTRAASHDGLRRPGRSF